MNISPFVLPLSIVFLSVSSLPAAGQEPVQPPTAVPGSPIPGGRSGRKLTPQQSEVLSTNYRVTFSGKSDDKSLGELSSLTCSENILISGPLNSSDTPTTFTVSGTLEEKDGLIIFNYSIEFNVPVAIRTQPDQPPPPGGSRSIQYQRHSSKGTLKMKAGKPYDLLRSGGNIYSIKVEPEMDK